MLSHVRSKRGWAQRLVSPTVVAGLAIGLLGAPRLAAAQGTLNSGCQASLLLFQDACQKTVDIFSYLAPQLSTAVAAGNANIGQASTLGGLGHFLIGIRANAVDGDIPKADNVTVSTTGPVSDSFPVTRVPVPMVTADASIGLFKGLPLGVTHVLGVDALLSALYIPTYNGNNVAVDPKHSLRIGYGARVGLLAESGFVPGVSFTYLQRGLPQTTVTAVTSGDTLRVADLDVTTKSWRFVAGKHLLFLGLAAGYGKDTYDASTSVEATVSGVPSGSTPLAAPKLTMTRTNYFGDVSLDFPVFGIGGEVGRVSSGTISTYNSFETKAAGASRLYASFGLHVKI
jgi:hypothetical protein